MIKNMRSTLFLLYRKVEQNRILMAVRQGMLLAVPLIMTGTLALLFLSIPIPKYQEWLQGLLGGYAAAFLTTVHSVTLGCVSLIVLVTVSLSYESISGVPYKGVTPLVSLCAYLAFTTGGDFSNLGVLFQSTWLFHAILCVCVSAPAFVWLQKHLPKGKRSFADGEDNLFQHSITAVIPAVMVIAAFTLLNRFLIAVLGDTGIQPFYWNAGNTVFFKLGRGLGSGLLFLFLMHLMWFFGIHGSNVLDNVARNVFNVGLDINIQQIAEGRLPTEIVSKSFFDTFVLFGGCGTLLCLVIAILLAERGRNVRKLTKVALFPALFNMNELMLFGLPVVLNPIYLIPFIMVPMLLAAISYVATALGLVPYVINNVEWTTPIFLSGYVATGSLAGSVLQVVNLAAGTAVYLPFVRWAGKSRELRLRESVNELSGVMQENEKRGIREVLTARSDNVGATAKAIAGNLHIAVRTGQLEMYYQPQVNDAGSVIGAEALLRWRYKTGQMLYPPLVIALAEETGQLEELGSFIIKKVCEDLAELTKMYGNNLMLSVNLTAEQITDGRVLELIREEISRYGLKGAQLGLELTEQTALRMSDQASSQLEEMRSLGTPIIMDDFGMGHSSMTYLRENRFDVVKLDGSIVRDILDNQRSRDIISSILYLSESLDFNVIAEYVETEEQRDILQGLGCLMYQGYLYGKPVTFEEFVKQLDEDKNP